MTYFTIVHWIFLIIYIIIFFAICFIAFRETKKKVLYAMLFANFLVISLLTGFTMLVLDKYTKKAKIYGFNQKRILRTEHITFSGKVRNIGKFTIGTCELKIKIVNDPIASKKMGGSDLFKPTLGIDIGKKEERHSTIVETFDIAKKLKPNELKNFSVSMPYPPYFVRATVHKKLTCK